MNAKRTYTIDTLPTDTTDWQKVKKLSEKEIEEAAHMDPDAPLLTATQLAQFKRASAT